MDYLIGGSGHTARRRSIPGGSFPWHWKLGAAFSPCTTPLPALDHTRWAFGDRCTSSHLGVWSSGSWCWLVAGPVDEACNPRGTLFPYRLSREKWFWSKPLTFCKISHGFHVAKPDHPLLCHSLRNIGHREPWLASQTLYHSGFQNNTLPQLSSRTLTRALCSVSSSLTDTLGLPWWVIW